MGGVLLTLALSAVTFEEAVAAVESLPQVVASRRAAGVVGEAAGSLPRLVENPTLSFDPGVRALSEANRGVELAVGVTQGFSLSGQRQRAQAVLDAETAHRQAMAAGLSLESRLTVAAAWLDVWALEQTFEFAHQSLQLAGEDRRRLEAGARARAFTSADVALARAHEAELRLTLLDAEGALFDARVALGLALGGQQPASVRGEPPSWPAPSDEAMAALLDRAQALPEAQVQALAAAMELAREREITARAGTHVQVGFFVAREAPEDLLAMVTTQLHLPFFDEGVRDRAPVQAEGLAQQGRAQQAVEGARGRLRQAAHEVRHTAQVLTTVQETLLPARVEHLRLVNLQFDHGAVTFAEKARAADHLLQARARGVRAAADEAFARVRMRWLAQALDGESR